MEIDRNERLVDLAYRSFIHYQEERDSMNYGGQRIDIGWFAKRMGLPHFNELKRGPSHKELFKMKFLTNQEIMVGNGLAPRVRHYLKARHLSKLNS